jgi:hypothetical protein
MTDETGSRPTPARNDAATDLQLRTLSPHYDEERHGIYVAALARAIDSQPTVRNLALTGAYGTGKSSILKEINVRYGDRVIQLSLSTVGGNPEPHADDDTDTTPSGNPAAQSKTNRIQKEIVKQLLYNEAPNKTRGSRFKRITRFRWWQQLAFAGITGAVVAALLYLADLGGPLVAAAGDDAGRIVLAYIALALVVATVVLAARAITHNRVFLEKLSAGPATVSLSANSASYFDEYLDEIVYHFEVSGRDIVIFEDIDRFEDVYIFETLRALNTLLNGSQQIRSRRRKGAQGKSEAPIRFIYALRDSVFAKIGEDDDVEAATATAKDELQRANRTKFFDLVIPVVPFITHRNARDLMDTAMEGTEVSKKLISLAARHVADMRLIWNIRNEYDIYSSQLLEPTDAMPGLDADRLFAMVLYKNVHLSDFEAIRLGTSKLDDLHDAWRHLVDTSIGIEADTVRNATQRQLTLDSIEARSMALGQKLMIQANILNSGGGSRRPPIITVDNMQLTNEQVESADIWKRVIGEKLIVSVQFQNGQSTSAIDIQFNDLGAFIGEKIDEADWTEVDRASISWVHGEAAANTYFLRHHDWREIYANRDFETVWTKPGSQPETPPRSENFQQLTSRILRSALARDLVAHGYINDYYALYISMYYGTHLRRDALNYIVHVVDQGELDMLYLLTPEDVIAILDDKTDIILRDPSMYNVSILDYLLADRPDAADTVLNQISSWTEAEQEIASLYLVHGARPRDFVQKLTTMFTDMFSFLISTPVLDDRTRIRMFDEAISVFRAHQKHNLGLEIRGFVEANYALFPSLTDESRADDGENAMSFVHASGAKFATVEPLASRTRSDAAKYGTFVVTEDNLIALAGTADAALDTLMDTNYDVYEQATANLSQYVESLLSAGKTYFWISSPVKFLSILEDLKRPLPADALEILKHTDPSIDLPTLTDAPESLWSALAAAQRFPATMYNVAAYINLYAGIDDALGALLSEAGSITESDEADPSSRQGVAIEILNARETIPSARSRVNLVVSLGLPDHLPVSDLVPEPGEFVGLLIGGGVINDGPEAFSAALMVDWSTRESAIEHSKAFSDFMDPTLVPASEIGSLIASGRIPMPVKEKLVQSIGDYAAGAPADAVAAVAEFASHKRIPITVRQLALLAVSGAPLHVVAEFVAQDIADLADEELQGLLLAMGGEYAQIASLTGTSILMPADDAHRVIYRRLKEIGVVESHKSVHNGVLVTTQGR